MQRVIFPNAGLADAGLHLTGAVLLAASFIGLGKGISDRAVPSKNVNNRDDFQFFRAFHDRDGPFVSFPSGHAAAIVAMAAVIAGKSTHGTQKCLRIVGPIAYGVAGLV